MGLGGLRNTLISCGLLFGGLHCAILLVYSSTRLALTDQYDAFFSADAFNGIMFGEGSNTSIVTLNASQTTANEPLMKHDDERETFSGCLLVMDDNHRLSEWLAYHWHVLPLTHLIVAADPRSTQSPEPILDRFRKELNMTIILWNEEDYAEWERLPGNASLEAIRNQHRLRQITFLSHCMKHLAEMNRTWTAMWDTDEFLVYNPYHGPNGENKWPNDLSERGNVMTFLNNEHEYRERRRSDNKGRHDSSHCIPIYRVIVGAKETPHTNWSKNLPTPLKKENLDTLRFLYRNSWNQKINGNGKAMLNVQHVDHNVKVSTLHRPAMQICISPQWDFTNHHAFMIHHYLGSWESYSFRNDSRKGNERTYEIWEHRAQKTSVHYSDHIYSWFRGFLREVGTERAVRLLKDAGLPEGYNASDKAKEWTCVRGKECGKIGKLPPTAPPKRGPQRIFGKAAQLKKRVSGVMKSV